MTTQVSFKVDAALKEKALTKVKKEGLNLKMLFTVAMNDYVRNRYRLGFVSDDNLLGVEDVDEKIDEKGWKTLIDFREIDPRGVDARDIIKAIKKIDG